MPGLPCRGSSGIRGRGRRFVRSIWPTWRCRGHCSPRSCANRPAAAALTTAPGMSIARTIDDNQSRRGASMIERKRPGEVSRKGTSPKMQNSTASRTAPSPRRLAVCGATTQHRTSEADHLENPELAWTTAAPWPSRQADEFERERGSERKAAPPACRQRIWCGRSRVSSASNC